MGIFVPIKALPWEDETYPLSSFAQACSEVHLCAISFRGQIIQGVKKGKSMNFKYNLIIMFYYYPA